MKECTKCGEYKKLDGFAFRKDRGCHYTVCRICRKDQRSKWTLKNKNKLNDDVVKWRKENPEKYRKHYTKWLSVTIIK